MLLIIHTFFITVTLTALINAIPVFKNEMASKYQPSSVSFPRAVKADDAHQIKAVIRPGIVPVLKSHVLPKTESQSKNPSASWSYHLTNFHDLDKQRVLPRKKKGFVVKKPVYVSRHHRSNTIRSKSATVPADFKPNGVEVLRKSREALRDKTISHLTRDIIDNTSTSLVNTDDVTDPTTRAFHAPDSTSTSVIAEPLPKPLADPIKVESANGSDDTELSNTEHSEGVEPELPIEEFTAESSSLPISPSIDPSSALPAVPVEEAETKDALPSGIIDSSSSATSVLANDEADPTSRTLNKPDFYAPDSTPTSLIGEPLSKPLADPTEVVSGSGSDDSEAYQKDNHSEQSEEIELQLEQFHPEQPEIGMESKTSNEEFPIESSSVPIVPPIDLSSALPIVPVEESETEKSPRAKLSDVTREIIDTSSSSLIKNAVLANGVTGPAARTLKKPIFHFPVSTAISRIGQSLFKPDSINVVESESGSDDPESSQDKYSEQSEEVQSELPITNQVQQEQLKTGPKEEAHLDLPLQQIPPPLPVSPIEEFDEGFTNVFTDESNDIVSIRSEEPELIIDVPETSMTKITFSEPAILTKKSNRKQIARNPKLISDSVVVNKVHHQAESVLRHGNVPWSSYFAKYHSLDKKIVKPPVRPKSEKRPAKQEQKIEVRKSVVPRSNYFANPKTEKTLDNQ